jgi:hypothetical protein
MKPVTCRFAASALSSLGAPESTNLTTFLDGAVHKLIREPSLPAAHR